MHPKNSPDTGTDSNNTLFIVSGMPASGKSTFARQLATKTRACLIDIDTATETIVQAAMQKLTSNADDRDSSVFKKTFREPIYRTLFQIADENLPHTHAIVTGPFTKELTNANWADEIQTSLRTPCRVKLVFLRCDHLLRKKRIIDRANPRDLPKLENWEEHLEYYNPNALPAYPHILVDTGQPNYFKQAIQEGLLP